MMYRYALCVGICAVIWTANVKWIIEGVRERVSSEIFMHAGLGTFLTLLALQLTLRWSKLTVLDFGWLRVIGFLLLIPSGILVFAALIELRREGMSGSPELSDATSFVESGVYGIIRQPMTLTLGLSIWSVGLFLVFQSLVSTILGALGVFCFWMSAIRESDFNITKFGDRYKVYMENVPMWNIIKGIRRR